MKRRAESIERQIWKIIEFVKIRNEYTDEDLARVTGVTSRTVRNDRKSPSSIPADRLVKYISLICDPQAIVSVLETNALNEKRPERI